MLRRPRPPPRCELPTIATTASALLATTILTRPSPTAPRNMTSFIIRAKKVGGIPSLVSPCPVTPAILPTPKFSPSWEELVDMVKEEWGVDGYGSMKGLIRLCPGGGPDEIYEEVEEGSSETDADRDGDVEEQHLELEWRLDHDLSRFEMVYPNLLENRVDDQDTHITQLEEENLEIKRRKGNGAGEG